MTRRILVLMVFAALVASGGEHGKIVGRVTDVNGQPVIGASIAVMGTELGAMAGANGDFVISFVSAGSHTLKATSIGFDAVIIKNVIVNADQTSKQDFRMKELVYQMESTLVTATIPLVRPAGVTTLRIQTQADIERQPVSTITQLISLQAGMTTDNQGTHLRGGRPDEVSYYVDGVVTKVPHDGGNAVNVARSAVEEVSIIPGGFEAEYGEALSGVVNIITKEGGEKIEAMLRYTTDEMFSSDLLNYGYNFYEGYLGGAVPSLKNVRYFVSGELYNAADYGPDNGLGRYRVDRPRMDYKAEGRLTYRLLKRGKITLGAMRTREQWRQYSTAWHYNLPHFVARTYKSNFVNSGLNYTLGKGTLLTIKGSYLQIGRWVAVRDTHQENNPDDVRFSDGLNARRWYEDYRYKGQFVIDDGEVDRRELIDTLTHYFSEMQTQNVDNPYGARGLFFRGDNRYWEYYYSTEYGVRADIIHNIGQFHEVKTGFNVSYIDMGDYLNTLPWDPLPFYDIYQREPIMGAGYIQDRVDWSGLVIRGGLRFDYLDANARGVRDPYDTTSWVYAAPSYRFSPRLGFSFPITDRLKFRFNYGHFFQVPPLDNLYGTTDPAVVRLAIMRGGQILGNPDLHAKKTIQYEVGFENQLTDELAFDLTAYFKDIYDLETVRQIVAIPVSYNQITNADYGNVKGFEFGLTKRLKDYWSGRIAYTLQYAKGTGSYAWEAYFDYISASPDPVTGTAPPIPAIDFWLDFDERHMLVADLGLVFPGDFGIGALRDFSVATVTTYHSGQPYTPTNSKGERTGDMNSARKPGYVNTDMRASRDIKLGPVGVGLHCSIYNLFNTIQVRNVYPSSGKPDWDDTDANYLPYQFSAFTIFSSYYHPAADFDHDGICTGTERYSSYIDARRFVQRDPNNYLPSFRVKFGASIKV